jgi:hypothetical protein
VEEHTCGDKTLNDLDGDTAGFFITFCFAAGDAT